MRHAATHVVTIIVCLLLIACMFAYIGWMQAYVARWKGANVMLPPNLYLAIHIANLLQDYWYVPLVVLLAIAAVSLASLCRGRHDS